MTIIQFFAVLAAGYGGYLAYSHKIGWLISCAAVIVCLCSGCGPNNDQLYHDARAAAKSQPPYAEQIGLGLRFGMPEAEVQHALEQLRQRDELVFRLQMNTLPIEPEPEYMDGKLVRLRMMLKGDGLPGDVNQLELIKLLDAEYGGKNYPHSIKETDNRSWFKDDMEVELACLPAVGYWLSYTNLKGEWPLVKQQLRDDSVRQAEEAKKL